MNVTLKLSIFLLAVVGLSISAHAQEQADMKKDKTGTNPINFSFDLRGR